MSQCSSAHVLNAWICFSLPQAESRRIKLDSPGFILRYRRVNRDSWSHVKAVIRTWDLCYCCCLACFSLLYCCLHKADEHSYLELQLMNSTSVCVCVCVCVYMIVMQETRWQQERWRRGEHNGKATLHVWDMSVNSRHSRLSALLFHSLTHFLPPSRPPPVPCLHFPILFPVGLSSISLFCVSISD